MKFFWIFLACLIIFSGFMGCESRDKKIAAFRQEPEVYVFCPKDNFKFVSSSDLVEGSGMGMRRVIVKREEDNALFAAISVSQKEFYEGDEIKILHVSFMHNPETPAEFLVVE